MYSYIRKLCAPWGSRRLRVNSRLLQDVNPYIVLTINQDESTSTGGLRAELSDLPSRLEAWSRCSGRANWARWRRTWALCSSRRRGIGKAKMAVAGGSHIGCRPNSSRCNSRSAISMKFWILINSTVQSNAFHIRSWYLGNVLGNVINVIYCSWLTEQTQSGK